MQNLVTEAQKYLVAAAERRHRLFLSIAGEHAWAESTATELLSALGSSALWVSDNPVLRSDAVDQNASRRWLGREIEHLVFDAHSGFDPNVFALLVGTIRSGGALILLTPPMESWPCHPDPVNRRCSVWGAAVGDSRYLARLALQVRKHSQILFEQPDQLTLVEHLPTAVPDSTDEEQTRLVHSISGDFDPSGFRLEVISGDRGRGKSAALGRLAAALAETGARKIRITAPRKAAIDVLMQHAKHAWPEHLPPAEQCLTFSPPDQLCQNPQPCDVLLVDEMGGLHLGLLQRLLKLYPRLIMAGTVHGYEGAGRGFHTRLKRHIKAQYAHCRWHQLLQPMRWAINDPLENSYNALLMLDAEPNDSPLDAPSNSENKLQFKFLDRDQLWADEALLRQVHGLLAAAHYRTRPLDLRQMLDGPNLRVAIMRAEQTVVAASLIAAEGPMTDKTLNTQIMAGTRRPAGHLLPQLLMQKLRLDLATPLRFWRIVRIAVTPSQQGQTIGSQFLSQIDTQAALAGVDCLGSVFAVDAAVLNFWQHAGYRAVTLGDNCEATSGSYALGILKPLNNRATALTVTALKAWNSTQNQPLARSHPALSAELRQALCIALSTTMAADDDSNNGSIDG